MQLFKTRNAVFTAIMIVFFMWLQWYQFYSAASGGFGFGLIFVGVSLIQSERVTLNSELL